MAVERGSLGCSAGASQLCGWRRLKGWLQARSLPSSLMCASSAEYWSPLCSTLIKWPGGTLAGLISEAVMKLSWPKVKAECTKPTNDKKGLTSISGLPASNKYR